MSAASSAWRERRSRRTDVGRLIAIYRTVSVLSGASGGIYSTRR
jgi:hypothetical protein